MRELIKKVPAFCEANQDILLCPQESVIVPYPEPVKSSPVPSHPF